AKGKPPVGNIRLDAYHKAGNVVVEINDDGGGLNKEKIFRKAIDRGLVKEGVELSDNKIFNMIFEPGFSTADNITDVSGRGVGMDVVRRNVEKMRGKIEIESALDKGSIFKILLPITLAIIDGIIVKVAGERYIFQVESVIEFVHPSQDDVFTVEGKGEMMKVHDDLYPIVRLDRCLGIEKEEKNAEEMVACIVESDFGRMCILVDELIGQQQVVIKNLGEKMKDIKGITGSTILGDGRVGLILDVNGIGELFR
ncbi:MAG: chemotaxis protein CheW, partial [Candidatus Omnitrophica bacterium]|nr:chemotaxis protein CheW [Candidatus Omnitrophota bacterium]